MKYSSKYNTNILAISLVCLYTLSAFKIYLPYLEYSVNYTYISKTLCENKNRPVKKCNGKCYLNKQLKKSADEASKEKTGLQQVLQQEMAVDFDVYALFPPVPHISDHHFLYKLMYSAFMPDYMSPPPQA